MKYMYTLRNQVYFSSEPNVIGFSAEVHCTFVFSVWGFSVLPLCPLIQPSPSHLHTTPASMPIFVPDNPGEAKERYRIGGTMRNASIIWKQEGIAELWCKIPDLEPVCGQGFLCIHLQCRSLKEANSFQWDGLSCIRILHGEKNSLKQ